MVLSEEKNSNPAIQLVQLQRMNKVQELFSSNFPPSDL